MDVGLQIADALAQTVALSQLPYTPIEVPTCRRQSMLAVNHSHRKYLVTRMFYKLHKLSINKPSSFSCCSNGEIASYPGLPMYLYAHEINEKVWRKIG